MPRVTKDAKEDELNKKKTTSRKTTTSAKKKTTKATITAKSDIDIKATKSKSKKETATKANTELSKSRTKKVTNVNTDKKEVKEKNTKTTTKTKKKVSTTKKSTVSSKEKSITSTAKKKSTTKAKKIDSNVVAEYYDLPYRYNETMVKILYQTPNVLFVYWDISDSDRENFKKAYGDNFFYNTKPILKVFNLTKGYNFEVEINDFANSWYINVNDANCDYKVELARKTIKYEENLNTDYIYVSGSNDIEFPNDHILLDDLPNKVKFKNVKTNSITLKDISTLHLIGINKIYNIHDFYKRFYKDEILDEINNKKLINPSSSSWN